MLTITNARIITENEILPLGSISCRNGRFCDDGSDIPGYDAKGCYLAPGFIDLHFHGVLGKLVDNGTSDLEEICRVLPKFGVTGFLPTVTPCEDDITHLAELACAGSEGSEILGFFLEGHYLQLTGAIRAYSKDYSMEKVRKLNNAAGKHKLVYGVSPEIPGLSELLPAMTKSGYPAFITHTAATAEQTMNAISLGAVHATHFYDVFPYPGDKEPGVRGCGAVEAILANKAATVDFILDGEHVEPIAVHMALACKGAEGVCLITDANINAGLPPGTYKGMGGDEVEVTTKGGPARMSKKSRIPGGLTGSGLTMDLAVKNAVHMLGLPIHQAVRMATLNPASVLGLQKRKGRVAKGYDADFVLLNNELEVNACFIGGKMVYEKQG